MSTEIAGRPVLRPAGNIAVKIERGLRKATKPPNPAPVSKPSPPNSPSKPSSPKTPPLTPHSRSPVSKPAALNSHQKLLPSQCLRKPPLPNSLSRCPSQNSSQFGAAGRDIAAKIQHSVPSLTCAQETAECVELNCTSEHTSAIGSNSSSAPASALDAEKPTSPISPRQPSLDRRGLNRKAYPNVSLIKSSGDVLQKTSSNQKGKIRRNPSKLGSHSLDEAQSDSSSMVEAIAAAKKAAALEMQAQKKLRVAEYGRKQSKCIRVAPDIAALPPLPVELKRCQFITPQSDPAFAAYHDAEWGVPVHNDRLLFELLVLVGAQVELSWSTILSKRDAYRDAFAGFDPSAVARFSDKCIQSLEADRNLMMHGGKIRGIVDNAQRILEIEEEFGSFDKYLWGFVNHKPMNNNHRYPKQVPVKTSKAETVSKDLVRRGLRFVGPTIIYSLMQAAGMTNDHLVQCFRHRECAIFSEEAKDLCQEQEACRCSSEQRENGKREEEM